GRCQWPDCGKTSGRSRGLCGLMCCRTSFHFAFLHRHLDQQHSAHLLGVGFLVGPGAFLHAFVDILARLLKHLGFGLHCVVSDCACMDARSLPLKSRMILCTAAVTETQFVCLISASRFSFIKLSITLAVYCFAASIAGLMTASAVHWTRFETPESKAMTKPAVRGSSLSRRTRLVLIPGLRRGESLLSQDNGIRARVRVFRNFPNVWTFRCTEFVRTKFVFLCSSARPTIRILKPGSQVFGSGRFVRGLLPAGSKFDCSTCFRRCGQA